MPDPSPQQLVLAGIRSLDTLTAAVRAVEKELDDLGAEVRAHGTYMRGVVPDVLLRVSALEAQVRRCEDRADQELTEAREEKRARWSSLSSVARALWASPAVQLLVTALAIGAVQLLGLRWVIDQGILTLPGAAP